MAYESIISELRELIKNWDKKLMSIPEENLKALKNKQNRNIKQIIGHMVDSASNNTHRVIHLQYQTSPLLFPDYANNGNNDRWIAIQNYDEKEWSDLICLWKSTNLHFCHVISNVNIEMLNNYWLSGLGEKITLKEMIDDFPRHFKLHLAEVEDLLRS